MFFTLHTLNILQPIFLVFKINKYKIIKFLHTKSNTVCYNLIVIQMKKEYKNIIISILVITIVSSNFIWYKLYTREKYKLKQAIIPSLKDDYFSN